MEPIKRVLLDLRGEQVELITGIAENTSEISDIKTIISKEYQARGYINPDKQSFDDEFEESSIYFGTSCNGLLLAAARITSSKILPTESVFYRFEMPERLENCTRDSLVEVGRLTARKRPGKNPLPRHIMSTVTIAALIDYGFKEDLCGGISTIKRSFLILFRRLDLPALHEIQDAELIYPKDGVLSGFFYETTDPPVPVFYREDEAKAIFDGLFRNLARTGKTLLDEPLQLISSEVLL